MVEQYSMFEFVVWTKSDEGMAVRLYSNKSLAKAMTRADSEKKKLNQDVYVTENTERMVYRAV